jgi:6-phosphogluconolactonase
MSPLSITVDVSGQYAYVADVDSAVVAQFTIGGDGSLTPMSTATVMAGNGPASITSIGAWE